MREVVLWSEGGVGMVCCSFFFLKQKTAYGVCSRDWSSDVGSSGGGRERGREERERGREEGKKEGG